MNPSDEAKAAWEKYRDSHRPKGNHDLYYSDNGAYWRDGYRAGRAAKEKEMKKQVVHMKKTIRLRSENFDRTSSLCSPFFGSWRWVSSYNWPSVTCKRCLSKRPTKRGKR